MALVAPGQFLLSQSTKISMPGFFSFKKLTMSMLEWVKRGTSINARSIESFLTRGIRDSLSLQRISSVSFKDQERRMSLIKESSKSAIRIFMD